MLEDNLQLKIRVNVNFSLFPEEAKITLDGQEGWMVGSSFYPEETVMKMIEDYNNNPTSKIIPVLTETKENS